MADKEYTTFSIPLSKVKESGTLKYTEQPQSQNNFPHVRHNLSIQSHVSLAPKIQTSNQKNRWNSHKHTHVHKYAM